MNIARPVHETKHLRRLSNCAEQRVIAASPFLLFVEANGGTLCVSFGRLNGPIEIQSDTHQTEFC